MENFRVIVVPSARNNKICHPNVALLHGQLFLFLRVYKCISRTIFRSWCQRESDKIEDNTWNFLKLSYYHIQNMGIRTNQTTVIVTWKTVFVVLV